MGAWKAGKGSVHELSGEQAYDYLVSSTPSVFLHLQQLQIPLQRGHLKRPRIEFMKYKVLEVFLT